MPTYSTQVMYKDIQIQTCWYTDVLKLTHTPETTALSSLDLFSADWMGYRAVSEWVSETDTSNKAHVLQDHRCQTRQRTHVAKRRKELTHEIVHNSSVIAICHSISCDNVASCIDQQCREDEPCSVRVSWCDFWAAVTHMGLALQWGLNYHRAFWYQ